MCFFPTFIGSVYKYNNLKIKNKWTIKPKNPGDEVIPSNPKCPGWNDDLICPKSFFGIGKGYKPGNLTAKLRLLVAHILLKHNEDPDKYADNVPDDDIPKKYTLEYFEGGIFLRDLEDNDANVEEDSEKSKGKNPESADEYSEKNKEKIL